MRKGNAECYGEKTQLSRSRAWNFANAAPEQNLCHFPNILGIKCGPLIWALTLFSLV